MKRTVVQAKAERVRAREAQALGVGPQRKVKKRKERTPWQT